MLSSLEAPFLPNNEHHILPESHTPCLDTAQFETASVGEGWLQTGLLYPFFCVFVSPYKLDGVGPVDNRPFTN